MSEKRFSVEDDDADIWEDNHFLAVAYNHTNAKKITERLNKLANENKELKQTNQKIYELISDYVNTHHSTSTMRLLKKIKKELKRE